MHKMTKIDKLELEIIKRLKPLNLNSIILFGSYSYGTPNKNSDIDLYVVTNDEFMPKSWKENSRLIHKVSKNLKDLRDEFAIDLIVHTKDMNKEFIELNSIFSKEIFFKGKSLL